MYACYIGYVTQAIVNNLAPILFIVFQTKYDIGLERLGRLVLFNFLFQIVIDILSIKVVDKIGYRAAMLLANFSSALGLVLMAILPGVIEPYTGLLISISIYAIGGGFFEVMVSPIVDNLPTERKQSNMALLHSFYCWGQAAVFLVTTLVLILIDTDKWVVLPLIWSVFPIVNFFLFAKVPIVDPPKGKQAYSIKELFSSESFIVFCMMITCAGASELAMSQWASFFAEKGLNFSKTAGDIAGPFLFSILMGSGRILFAWLGMKRNLNIAKVIAMFATLCIVCYLTAALAPMPIISLIACAMCGFAISVMWPGVLSMSSKKFPRGSTAMFAFLAIFGDIGCGLSPWITGFVSDMVSVKRTEEFGIRIGLLVATIFPIILLGISLKKSEQPE